MSLRSLLYTTAVATTLAFGPINAQENQGNLRPSEQAAESEEPMGQFPDPFVDNGNADSMIIWGDPYRLKEWGTDISGSSVGKGRVSEKNGFVNGLKFGGTFINGRGRREIHVEYENEADRSLYNWELSSPSDPDLTNLNPNDLPFTDEFMRMWYSIGKEQGKSIGESLGRQEGFGDGVKKGFKEGHKSGYHEGRDSRSNDFAWGYLAAIGTGVVAWAVSRNFRRRREVYEDPSSESDFLNL